MPPVTLDCTADELTAFLPGRPDLIISGQALSGADDPNQLLGKVLQFDLIDVASAESLIWPQTR